MKHNKFPHPVYAATVLEANFADAQRFFLDDLIDIEYAHTRMLARQGILTRDEATTLLAAFGNLDMELLRTAKYDGSHEDLFFFLEAQLERLCGREIAGKAHIARSRNDIAITLYRMEIRKRLVELSGDVLDLSQTLTEIAGRHTASVMPAHTHTQPAQPTTLGHYLMGVVEVLARDLGRLQAAYATTNRSPLGSCAITTTGFPIHRDYTARLLAFDGLQVNSYGAIAAVDYVLESAGAVCTAMVNASKLIHDLLLWCMQEFGYVRLSDAFVQTSSIMPQKRNPVAIEHARILCSRAFGKAQAIFTTAHNTPFGDIVDSEDDLQPLVFAMFEDASRAIRLLAASMRDAEFDTDRMRSVAGSRFLTVTELADTLVRKEGLSFRQAHEIVSESVRRNPADDSHERIADDVHSIAAGVLARPLITPRERLLRALDPDSFIAIRDVVGGPAKEQIEAQIRDAEQAQSDAEKWLRRETARLEEYRSKLRSTSVADGD